METVFGGMRAPSTLGFFLHAFIWENGRQLDRCTVQRKKLLFKGLNALISLISTPLAAAQSGLRGGSAGSARGAAGQLGGLEADLRGRLACGVAAGGLSRGESWWEDGEILVLRHRPYAGRHSSVAPATQRPTALRDDRPRDKEEQPA